MSLGLVDKALEMIGYFIKSGDASVSKMFTPYVWRESGFATQLDRALWGKNYGEGLDLLLIQYYVEGRFPVFGPSQLKVKNYSAKDKDIAVAIPVKRSEFHEVSETQRRRFIVSSTLNAIEAVRTRLYSRKLNVDFDELYADVERVGKYFASGADGLTIGSDGT